jgi:hypothetical protein
MPPHAPSSRALRAHGAERACVGIGISNAEQVAGVLEYADGAIVGTALVRALRDGGLEGLAETARGSRRRHRPNLDLDSERRPAAGILTSKERSPMINAAASFVASIPSPTISYFDIGPLRIHFYALCIIAGIIAAVLLTNWRLTGGEPSVGRDRHLPDRGSAGDHRRAHLSRAHPPRFLFRPGHRLLGDLPHLGRRHRDLRRPHRRRDRRVARLPVDRHPLLDVRRRARPGSCSRRRSAASATGSTRSCSACRPTCRGASRSTADNPAFPPGSPGHALPPDVPLRGHLERLGVLVLLWAGSSSGCSGAPVRPLPRLVQRGRIVWESIRIDPSEIILGLRTNVWAAIFGVVLGS